MGYTIEEIRDRLEIDDLLTRYATAVDTQNWSLYDSCFTPDAFIDYTSAGGVKGDLKEVSAWLSKTMKIFPMTQHVVSNRDIQLNGDEASGRSVFYNPMGLPDPDGGLKLFIDGGYYNDKFVRTSEGWKIAERIEESSYSTRLHPILPPMRA